MVFRAEISLSFFLPRLIPPPPFFITLCKGEQVETLHTHRRVNYASKRSVSMLYSSLECVPSHHSIHRYIMLTVPLKKNAIDSPSQGIRG